LTPSGSSTTESNTTDEALLEEAASNNNKYNNDISDDEWASLLEANDGDASAIDEVCAVIDEMQDEAQNSRVPIIPTIIIPNMLQNMNMIPLPSIPSVPFPVSSSMKAPTEATEATTVPYAQHLTRRDRVLRWQAKRLKRKWAKKNTHNEYYGVRKQTASKRKRVAGKFSGSTVSWVAA